MKPAKTEFISPADHLARRHILVLLDGRGEYDRGLLRGIRRFVDERPGWSLHFLFDHTGLRATLSERSFTGILWDPSRLSERVRNNLTQRQIPLISLSELPAASTLSGVGLDNQQIGQMAAEHLLALGINHFGYVGITGVPFSDHRGKAFAESLRQSGLNCTNYHLDHQALAMRRSRRLENLPRWLQQFKQPVAIFAANDSCALEVLNACSLAKLDVPEKCLVLGVDNDELLCELAQPALSSIAIPSEKLGYEAATMLEEMVNGAKASTGARLLAPLRVVSRQSTALHQSADPVVVNAQRFITEHLDQPIGVNDVARAAGVCRRLLERRMRQMLQKTPLQEIRRQRIQRAQALLIGGDLTLNQIAIACGFNTAPLFSEIFRKETGLTPGKYRQQQR